MLASEGTATLAWVLILLVVGYYLFDLNRRQHQKMELRKRQLDKMREDEED